MTILDKNRQVIYKILDEKTHEDKFLIINGHGCLLKSCLMINIIVMKTFRDKDVIFLFRLLGLGKFFNIIKFKRF